MSKAKILTVALAAVTAGGLAIAASCPAVAAGGRAAAAAQPPPLVGILKAGRSWALRPLDPRTLTPLAGSWSQPVNRSAVVTRSPLGTGVAAAWATDTTSGAIVVNTRTGQLVRRYTDVVDGSSLYWFGGRELPLAGRSGPMLITAGDHCYSFGCGTEFEIIDSGSSEGWEGEILAVLRNRFVLGGPPWLYTLALPRDPFVDGLAPHDIPLPSLPPGMPRAGPSVRVVADVAGDRLYEVSSSGLITRVDAASRRPTVTYHRVPLNGRPFKAAWAGQGRIALWGADGLGTIDTRTWTTTALAPAATDALPTAYGIATWITGTPNGISVYQPSGPLRFRVLETKTVRSAEALGRYLYVRAGRGRYAVDLASGRLLGLVRSDVTIAQPSFVPLP